MILLVGGEKGGSGKSCLAQNLAVYLRSQFQGEVLLVDCDPQRTTSDWIQERNDNPELPQINCVQLYGNIRNDLLSLKNRYDYVIVDCGGQDNRALRSTMAVATHALIPLRPKRRDLKTLPHMEDLITTCKMVNPTLNAAVVLTQCPALPNQVKRILEAKEVCASFGVDVLNAITYGRNVYDDSEEKGLSVMEIEPDGKSAEEIRAIAKEFLQVGGCEMGLADLKKKHQLHHQKKFTVDEFIEDAEFYAKGKPKVVSLELSLHRDEALSALAFIESGEHLRPSYKKATFSMSTVAIDELGNLTQQDGMNKSLLLRLFTHYFSSLTPEERQTIYERLNQRS